MIENLVEVDIGERENFLKILETLTRIGVGALVPAENEGDPPRDILYQSCHLLHKRGKYYLVHFKELYELDGRPSSITEEDIGRRNKIALLLEEWGLLKVLDHEKVAEPLASLRNIKIVPHKEKSLWILQAKHPIGTRNRRSDGRGSQNKFVV